MTELLIKWRINLLNDVLLSELMSLNCSEISTYKKIAFWTEECTKFAWYIIKNYSKNQKQSFL